MNKIDEDLQYSGYTQIGVEEIMKLRQAIRYHRDQKGDNRCWLDDNKLYECLPETNTAELTLPPKNEFLGSCERFYECRQGKTFNNVDECYDTGTYRSIEVPEQ